MCVFMFKHIKSAFSNDRANFEDFGKEFRNLLRVKCSFGKGRRHNRTAGLVILAMMELGLLLGHS